MKQYSFVFLFLLSLFFTQNSYCDNNDKKIRSMIFKSSENERSIEDKNIQIIDVFVPHERKFLSKVSRFIGQDITIENLQKIREEVLTYYKSYGYAFVSINMLEQEITDGKVEFLVIVSNVDNVSLQPGRYFSKKLLQKYVTLKKGEILNEDQIIKNLWWLNNNPFRNSSAFFKEGEGFGTTDVSFKVSDEMPIRVFAEYECSGNLIAGDTRYSTGFNWGNVFGLDQILNYQFITSPTTKRWWAQTASYSIPLPWKNIFKVIGFYSKTDPKASEIQDYSISGKAWQVSARYEIPIIMGTFFHQFDIGYDFKRMNNFLSFTGITTSNSKVDISQFVLTYSLTKKDNYGNNYFKLDCFVSPGDMSAYNKNANFQTQRAGSKKSYIYARASYDRLTELYHNFLWALNLKIQGSNKKLLPSEELSIGGYTTIRGYKENEIIADDGIILRNELRTPTFALFIRKKAIKDQFQLLVFLDLGWAFSVDQTIYTKKHVSLSGIGPGLRYNYKDNVSVRFDYGFQLKNIDRINENHNEHSKVHASVSLAF